MPSDGVRELARRLDDDRHASELHLRELVVADRAPEHRAVERVLRGRLVRRLHHADGPRGGLQPAVLEALHLVVEAAAEAGLAADEAVVRHEPSVERDLVGVHAAVADRVDGPALHLPAGLLLRELEAMALATRLRHDEEREAAVGLRAVGIGAGQEHQHVGAGRRTCTTS